MNTNRNSKNGDMLSILGYGCMRFPLKGNAIDEDEAEKHLIAAIEGGVNYFDTAYIYHGGKSESFLGKVLAKGYRDRVKIATKLPVFSVRRASDIDKIFNTQLERLQTDRIDYYLMHVLPDVNAWERLKAMGIEQWIEARKKAGQIINIGFSYHGSKAEFKRLIDAYDWDFCQIQYNYLDENNQAGKTSLLYAASKGIPVIAMEPLRGGKIVNDLPPEVNALWQEATPRRSVAEWALRWVWNHPEILLLLSGMSTMEQVQDNLRIASDARANSLSADDLKLFDRAREILSSKTKVGCTACGYCMPCPAGVDIPTCFACYNLKYLNGKKGSRFRYIRDTGAWAKQSGNASKCIQCRKCEKHCPQGIVVSERMGEVTREMEGPLFKPLMAVIRKFMG